MDITLSKLWEIIKDREAWHSAVHEVRKSWNDWVIEQQQIKIKPCPLFAAVFTTCICYGHCETWDKDDRTIDKVIWQES